MGTQWANAHRAFVSLMNIMYDYRGEGARIHDTGGKAESENREFLS